LLSNSNALGDRLAIIGHGTPEQSRRKEIKMQLASPLRVYSLKGDVYENTIENDDCSGVATRITAVDDAARRCL
jgi:hypothetical protein